MNNTKLKRNTHLSAPPTNRGTHPSPRPSPHQMGRGCPAGRVRRSRAQHAFKLWRFSLSVIAGGILLTGCGKTGSEKTVEIRAKGSDTMIQLATAWAEAYRKVKPNVFVNANGGGSGTGIAALQNNTTDICNASREMKPEE